MSFSASGHPISRNNTPFSVQIIGATYYYTQVKYEGPGHKSTMQSKGNDPVSEVLPLALCTVFFMCGDILRPPYCLLLLAVAKLDLFSTSRKYIVVLVCN